MADVPFDERKEPCHTFNTIKICSLGVAQAVIQTAYVHTGQLPSTEKTPV